MKKIFFMIFLIMILVSGFVFAQTAEDNMNPVACETFGECFNKIASVLLNIGIAAISVSIIIAGAIFVTGGTPARISQAKKILLLGIGIFIIMLLVKFVAIISKDQLTITKP